MHITRPNVVVRAGRTITGCKVLFPAMVPMMNGIRNNINNRPYVFGSHTEHYFYVCSPGILLV